MNVDPGNHPFKPGYELKLNSYDLGVDMELADVVQRLRFEHPQVKVVVVGSAQERAFCAGANIWMLADSTHPFKVNFCKYTNETRLSLEDASQHSGLKSICAVNAACAGGGYELALACDEIHLVNDNNSAVSLPEVPLLGVLPGTGGLTRLVDKRKVRRDRADVFCTMAEGMRGKKAVAWGLVDAIWPKSQFADKVQARARELAASLPTKVAADAGGKTPKGISLPPIRAEVDGTRYRYQYVELVVDPVARTARLTVHGPPGRSRRTAPDMSRPAARSLGAALLSRARRRAAAAALRPREVGLLVLETRGDAKALLAVEQTLLANRATGSCNEILLQMARTLRRFDLMARSMYAWSTPRTCAAGAFLELTLACDRVYMLDDDKVQVAIGPLGPRPVPCR
jgi:benzoyl-CoA-dihydrodiol lyase